MTRDLVENELDGGGSNLLSRKICQRHRYILASTIIVLLLAVLFGWVKMADPLATATIPVSVQEDRDSTTAHLFLPEMVPVPAGEFLMGSPDSEAGRDQDEGPQRRVSVQAFELSKTEVTFTQYDAFATATGRALPYDGLVKDGWSPRWGRKQRPVINVSWQDAVDYTRWLSRQTGDHYRLPSEAEWEYAARAGTTTPFSTGECITDRQANFNNVIGFADNDCPRTSNMKGKTTEVGSYPASAFGLHDMHGNVFEWVQDCYGDYRDAPDDGSALETEGCEYRVMRGGSFFVEQRLQRSANRARIGPDFSDLFLGFRVARDLP